MYINAFRGGARHIDRRRRSGGLWCAEVSCWCMVDQTVIDQLVLGLTKLIRMRHVQLFRCNYCIVLQLDHAWVYYASPNTKIFSSHNSDKFISDFNVDFQATNSSGSDYEILETFVLKYCESCFKYRKKNRQKTRKPNTIICVMSSLLHIPGVVKSCMFDQNGTFCDLSLRIVHVSETLMHWF